MTSLEAENLKIVQRYWDALAARDQDAMHAGTTTRTSRTSLDIAPRWWLEHIMSASIDD